MKHKYLFFPILACLMSCLIFSSCSPSLQYDVLVENKTNEVLSIAFKSEVDRRGVVEEVLELKPLERKRIISSKNLDTGDGKRATSAEHCGLVAAYVTASLQDGTKSSKSWCDQNIRFEKVDIQQAEFTVVYTADDF